jgi:hypothetical protein
MKNRSTNRKFLILEFLEEDGDRDPIENGLPPYNATTIANVIEGSWSEFGPKASPSAVQSVARTLRGMVKEGVLVAVREKQPVHNAIADNMIMTPVTCYYSARTMEHDIQRAKVWEAGGAERQERGFAAFAAVIAQSRGLPVPELARPVPTQPNVIDMGAAEIVEPDGEWHPF